MYLCEGVILQISAVWVVIVPMRRTDAVLMKNG